MIGEKCIGAWSASSYWTGAKLYIVADPASVTELFIEMINQQAVRMRIA